MIKLLTTHKIAWIGFLVALVASFIMAATTHAQETDQEAAKKHGITFPISELGGCGSISECRTYCEDPVNKSSCVSFAKQKGFYKEQTDDRQKEMLEKATGELGCNSPDACRELCHQEANFDKCSSFAKKNNFSGGQVDDPARAEVLQKARQSLGCDSPDSCRDFCQQEGNRQKCSEFAKDSGLRGGEKRVGPGGCSSEETCKSFCSDPANFSSCSSFGGGQGGPNGQGGTKGQFKGPGGCTSEESCRSHCEQNPGDCKIVPGQFSGAGPIDNPEQAAEQFKKFCQDSPDKCQGGNFSPFSKEGRGKFEEFCKDNPERCRGEGDKFRGFEPRGNPEQLCKDNPEKCRQMQEGFGGRDPEGQGIEDRSGQFQNQDQFCKDNPEKCRPGGPNENGQGKRPEDFKNALFDQRNPPGSFKPGDKPPDRFKPNDSQRSPEGFKPQEGTNRPPEEQRPDTTGNSSPGDTAPPPGGSSPSGN